MARLQITIDVPDWTIAELRQAVRDIDVLDDPVPITVEYVDVKDILTYMFSGLVGPDHIVLQQSMDDQEMRMDDNGSWTL